MTIRGGPGCSKQPARRRCESVRPAAVRATWQLWEVRRRAERGCRGRPAGLRSQHRWWQKSFGASRHLSAAQHSGRPFRLRGSSWGAGLWSLYWSAPDRVHTAASQGSAGWPDSHCGCLPGQRTLLGTASRLQTASASTSWWWVGIRFWQARATPGPERGQGTGSGWTRITQREAGAVVASVRVTTPAVSDAPRPLRCSAASGHAYSGCWKQSFTEFLPRTVLYVVRRSTDILGGRRDSPQPPKPVQEWQIRVILFDD